MSRLDVPHDRILWKKEVTAIAGCSYTRLWQLMCEGEFPRGLKIGGRTGWRASEVQRWLDQLPRRRLKVDKR